jgi:hypothetical protein
MIESTSTIAKRSHRHQLGLKLHLWKTPLAQLIVLIALEVSLVGILNQVVNRSDDITSTNMLFTPFMIVCAVWSLLIVAWDGLNFVGSIVLCFAADRKNRWKIVGVVSLDLVCLVSLASISLVDLNNSIQVCGVGLFIVILFGFSGFLFLNFLKSIAIEGGDEDAIRNTKRTTSVWFLSLAFIAIALGLSGYLALSVGEHSPLRFLVPAILGLFASGLAFWFLNRSARMLRLIGKGLAGSYNKSSHQVTFSPKSSFVGRLFVPLAMTLSILFCVAASGMIIQRDVQKRAEQSEVASLPSTAKMREILQALTRYESDHGVYPPAYVWDKDGKPLYSWRVMILPYFGPEELQLFHRFNKSKAWDSPENIALSQRIVSVYRSPNDPTGQCGYMALTGPGSLFFSPQSVTKEDELLGRMQVRRNDIKDDMSTTIAFVQVEDRQSSWAAPIDVDVSQVRTLFGTGAQKKPFQVAFVEGGGFSLIKPTLNAESRILAMTSIAGGETIDYE